MKKARHPHLDPNSRVGAPLEEALNLFLPHICPVTWERDFTSLVPHLSIWKPRALDRVTPKSPLAQRV